MSPYLLLVIVLAWGGSVAGAGYLGYGAGQDQVNAFNAKAADVVQATRESAQQAAAEAIAANRPKNTTIVNEVRREIQTNTVYAECKHSAAGLRGVNAALTGQRPEPAGGGQLPAADAAAR